MPAPKAIALTALVPAEYDYISLAYTDANLTTVVYKTNGSTGTTVATLTLAYTGSTLNSITRNKRRKNKCTQQKQQQQEQH